MCAIAYSLYIRHQRTPPYVGWFREQAHTIGDHLFTNIYGCISYFHCLPLFWPDRDQRLPLPVANPSLSPQQPQCGDLQRDSLLEPKLVCSVSDVRHDPYPLFDLASRVAALGARVSEEWWCRWCFGSRVPLAGQRRHDRRYRPRGRRDALSALLPCDWTRLLTSTKPASLGQLTVGSALFPLKMCKQCSPEPDKERPHPRSFVAISDCSHRCLHALCHPPSPATARSHQSSKSGGADSSPYARARMLITATIRRRRRGYEVLSVSKTCQQDRTPRGQIWPGVCGYALSRKSQYAPPYPSAGHAAALRLLARHIRSILHRYLYLSPKHREI